MGFDEIVGGGDRRRFLTGVGAATLGIGATAMIGGRAAAAIPQASDVGVIQTALALEHEGIAAYQLAGKSGLLSPGTLKVALIFMGHHQQHRDSLAKLVAQLGDHPVEPKTDAQYSADLEQGAASAYLGQITALKDPKIAQLFASISADEAVHWTTLNNAAGTPIPTGAYLFG